AQRADRARGLARLRRAADRLQSHVRRRVRQPARPGRAPGGGRPVRGRIRLDAPTGQIRQTRAAAGPRDRGRARDGRWRVTEALLAGAVAGLGVFLLIRALFPARAGLAARLSAMDAVRQGNGVSRVSVITTDEKESALRKAV